MTKREVLKYLDAKQQQKLEETRKAYEAMLHEEQYQFYSAAGFVEVAGKIEKKAEQGAGSAR